MNSQSNQPKNVTDHGIWLRGLYMVLFVLVYNVAEAVMLAVALFQFANKLITKQTNTRVLEFGQNLSLFIYQIWRFLTFNSESLPFPFAPWPDSKVTDRGLPNP